LLRIGIITDNEKVPAWANGIVNELIQYKNIQWTTIIHAEGASSDRDNVAFKLFRKVDEIILPGNPILSERVNLKLPPSVPIVRVKLTSNGLKSSVSSEYLGEVSKTKPDLLLYFGSEILEGEILYIPLSGVLTLHFGDPNRPSNCPPGFWEWFHPIPVTRVSIVRLKNEPTGNEILATATTRTEFLSLSRNQTAIFSRGIDLFVNSVVRIADIGKFPDPGSPPRPLNKPKSDTPDLWNSMVAIIKLATRILVKSVNKTFFIEQWILFFSFNQQSFPQLNFEKFKALIPPKDRIWADPFVVSKDGIHYLFIEELLKKTNRGHISCLVLNQNGEIETSRIIIERPYHLSYPFIFQHKDSWYMIPESGENKTVDLFECTSFPFEWKYKQTLLSDVEAFDSTIHFREGLYWLFCTIKKSQGASSDDDLYLFYSRDFLVGDWQPHPGNPVISDPAIARPAGRIFMYNNILYRPSQICVPRYGYGLSLNRILELNETSYKEEKVSQELPNWRSDLLSVHTFNFTEDITFIDGQLKRLKF